MTPERLEAWTERQLANAPVRNDAWRRVVMKQWGLKPTEKTPRPK